MAPGASSVCLVHSPHDFMECGTPSSPYYSAPFEEGDGMEYLLVGVSSGIPEMSRVLNPHYNDSRTAPVTSGTIDFGHVIVQPTPGPGFSNLHVIFCLGLGKQPLGSELTRWGGRRPFPTKGPPAPLGGKVQVGQFQNIWLGKGFKSIPTCKPAGCQVTDARLTLCFCFLGWESFPIFSRGKRRVICFFSPQLKPWGLPKLRSSGPLFLGSRAAFA